MNKKVYITHIRRLKEEKDELKAALACERAYRHQVTEVYERRLRSKILSLFYFITESFSSGEK